MSALEDARQAVLRSDQAQIYPQNTLPMATQGETRALRDAVRALIQYTEELEERLSRVAMDARRARQRTAIIK